VQGGEKAQFSLGVIYLNGEGVLRDWHEAGLWLQKAVDQGHTQAHFFLGHLKEHQDDYQAAIVHYRAVRSGPAGGHSKEVHVRIRRCVEAAAIFATSAAISAATSAASAAAFAAGTAALSLSRLYRVLIYRDRLLVSISNTRQDVDSLWTYP
jgi:hypothetical protein